MGLTLHLTKSCTPGTQKANMAKKVSSLCGDTQLLSGAGSYHHLSADIGLAQVSSTSLCLCRCRTTFQSREAGLMFAAKSVMRLWRSV